LMVTSIVAFFILRIAGIIYGKLIPPSDASVSV
jgi:hypothetical protein